MTELEKLDAGLPYSGKDPAVRARKIRAANLCHQLNAVPPAEDTLRERLARELLGSAGEALFIGPNFHCVCGFNIRASDNFFVNYNVTILDRAGVCIGDNVMIGPNVLISTVSHPTSPMERRAHMSFAKPITIGSDVWIGGNAVILPGITIGDNAIVAAGAVVTHDVAPNCIVAGVPAVKLRDIENDTDGARLE